MNTDGNREEALFEEALRKASDSERAAFLDEACRDDPQLRVRLEALPDGHFKAHGSATHQMPG